MQIAAAVVAALVVIQAARVDALLQQLDRYIEQYESRLSELIADEVMNQEAQRQEAGPERRRLASEVAFIALPNDAGWLGFRHVKTVNGRTVDEDASLARALASSVTSGAAQRLLESSAQHNLGLPRTTNLPNLPLEFLHQRNRRRFVARWDGSERVRGRATTRLAFIERITPTLIRDPDGSDMWSAAKAWIEPATGHLLRAEVRSHAARGGETTNVIRVEFAPNDTLRMLVPIEMVEEFPSGPHREGRSVARYSNYRRFQTSARIVPQ